MRDEVAVRPLLALLRVVLNLARGDAEGVDPQVAVDTLLSPIGGADAVALRRLRRALRREELAGGGGRTSDELLAEALVHPDRLATLGAEAAPARRVARTIAAGVEAAEVRREGTMVRWESGVSAESVLWAMWSATGLARAWQDTALGGGPGRSAPTATSMPWWGCSTRPPSSPTGCHRPAPRSSSPTSRARTSRATPWWRGPRR